MSVDWNPGKLWTAPEIQAMSSDAIKTALRDLQRQEAAARIAAEAAKDAYDLALRRLSEVQVDIDTHERVLSERDARLSGT